VDVDGRPDSHRDHDIYEILAPFRIPEFLFRQRHGSHTIFQHYRKTKFSLNSPHKRNVVPARNLRPEEQGSGIAIDDSGHRNPYALHQIVAFKCSAELAINQIENMTLALRDFCRYFLEAYNFPQKIGHDNAGIRAADADSYEVAHVGNDVQQHSAPAG